MRLVEDDEPERGILEEAVVPATGEEVLELVDVREQDPRGLLLHLLLGDPLFWRDEDDIGVARESLRSSIEVLARGKSLDAPELGVIGGRAPDVHAEGDPGPGEEAAEALELVRGQRVHGVDEERSYARRHTGIPEPEAVVEDRIEECLGLPGAGAGRDEAVPTSFHSLEDVLLVREHPRVLGNAGDGGMECACFHQIVEEVALGVGAGEGDVGTLDELGLGPHPAEHLAGLGGEVGVGKRESGELVAEELVVDFVSEGDGIEGHGSITGSTVMESRG